MATDPQTLARYQKSNGYISGRAAAAPPPALADLAVSNPAVRTAFERAGLLPVSEASARAAPPRPAPAREASVDDRWDAAIAAVCAEAGLEPRGGLAHAPRVSPAAVDDRWDAAIAAVCAEAGLEPRGGLAHAPRVSPAAGADRWDAAIAAVCAEAGLEPHGGLAHAPGAAAQTSLRGAPLAPSFAAPDAGRTSTGEGAAPWGSIIAQLNEEAGLTNKARDRANE